MEQSLEAAIKQLISKSLHDLKRGDLYRDPLVSFSAATDPAYDELKTIIGDWHKTPKELFPEARSVISYFIPFTKAVAYAPRRSESVSPVWGEAYQEINEHFNIINKAVAELLSEAGYISLTLKPTHTYDPKDLKCMWSHRSAAVIAGLGTFGANRLVITDKGSCGRFCSIITSAPLQAARQPAVDKCLYKKDGSCGMCFKICPVQAIRPDSMAKFRCQDRLFENEADLKASAGLQSADVCGKCISICPFSYIE